MSSAGSRTLFAMAAILVGLMSCQRASPHPPQTEGQLLVFAATSLKDAFNALGDEFKRSHPQVEVQFNFAGTQELRVQLEHGAAADVFASADARHMEALRDAQRVAAPVVFARNALVLIVAADSVQQIRSLADLPRARRIVVGAPEVPIGRYTERLLENATRKLGPEFRTQVDAAIVSRELNVRQVLAKARLGEAQAGFVYRTDVWPEATGVHVVALPSDVNVTAEYPIAAVAGAAHPQLAAEWIDLVLSPAGQRLLQSAGFEPALGEKQP